MLIAENTVTAESGNSVACCKIQEPVWLHRARCLLDKLGSVGRAGRQGRALQTRDSNNEALGRALQEKTRISVKGQCSMLKKASVYLQLSRTCI